MHIYIYMNILIFYLLYYVYILYRVYIKGVFGRAYLVVFMTYFVVGKQKNKNKVFGWAFLKVAYYFSKREISHFWEVNLEWLLKNNLSTYVTKLPFYPYFNITPTSHLFTFTLFCHFTQISTNLPNTKNQLINLSLFCTAIS